MWYVVDSCTGMKDSQILEADLSIDRVVTWRYPNSRKWLLDVRVIIVEKTRFYPQARKKWETKTSSRRREKSARVASSWFRDSFRHWLMKSQRGPCNWATSLEEDVSRSQLHRMSRLSSLAIVDTSIMGTRKVMGVAREENDDCIVAKQTSDFTTTRQSFTQFEANRISWTTVCTSFASMKTYS